MYGKTFRSGVIAVIGLVLLAGQGCSSKWWQSDGETEAGQSGNSQFPTISGGGSSGELSGFSQNPSEERLQRGGGIAAVSSSGMNERQRAELTKEEKAAIEAGLQDVFFGYDQWVISDSGMNALNRDAEWLKAHPGAVMKVEGHCDERGTGEYNFVLGEKRAKAARSYLVEMGVAPKQIAIISYGKERPFCAEHDEACYQQNRRGHVLLSVKKK
ncbi:MAG TPA: peptidoglycan-associated lipoprotein Pal [Nitrospiraceae bacterium]|nr:peptidoglycan-associated lipoprotein Pal [Nitrospiraceae bacterium]